MHLIRLLCLFSLGVFPTACSCSTEGCFVSGDISARGLVTTREQTPVEGVTVRCSDRDGGALSTTNAAGFYSFTTSHMFQGAGCTGNCPEIIFSGPGSEFESYRTGTSILSGDAGTIVLRRRDGG